MRKIIIFLFLIISVGGVAIATYMMPEKQDYTVVSDDKLSMADAEKEIKMPTEKEILRGICEAEDNAEYVMIGDQKWIFKGKKIFEKDYVVSNSDEFTYITIDESVKNGDGFFTEEEWSYTDENGKEQTLRVAFYNTLKQSHADD